jgi:hypothetical protein
MRADAPVTDPMAVDDTGIGSYATIRADARSRGARTCRGVMGRSGVAPRITRHQSAPERRVGALRVPRRLLALSIGRAR